MWKKEEKKQTDPKKQKKQGRRRKRRRIHKARRSFGEMVRRKRWIRARDGTGWKVGIIVKIIIGVQSEASHELECEGHGNWERKARSPVGV
jgi:ribosomal protein S4